MDATAFRRRFIEFCELNRLRRSQELRGDANLDFGILSRWQQALDSLAECCPQSHERVLVGRAMADPYFPVSMLRKLSVAEIAREPKFAGLDEETRSSIIAEHLLNWAEIFHRIRRDLVELNSNGRVSTMSLQGSPQESLSESSGCDYCGGCCEIRGGPPEFTDGFEPPERWFLYFRGDGCSHQRFCPFLFEYFATGRFFCSIYRVKPKCCWTFDREECEFLQKDLARERAEHDSSM